MTLRTFSMRAGLAASTVTPGSTPPEASRTTPTMLLCADASPGSSTNAATATRRANCFWIPIDRPFVKRAIRSPSRLQAPGPAAQRNRKRKQLRIAASWLGSMKLPQKPSGA